jgi:hypothetical protein
VRRLAVIHQRQTAPHERFGRRRDHGRISTRRNSRARSVIRGNGGGSHRADPPSQAGDRPNATETKTDADADADKGKGSREVALVSLDLPSDWFEQFWKKYPNKVDPKGSKKKLVSVLKAGTPFQTIMDGLDRYVAKTDDRPWCNPTTWINQARWDHRPVEVAPHGKAKTGGRSIDALREQAAFL